MTVGANAVKHKTTEFFRHFQRCIFKDGADVIGVKGAVSNEQGTHGAPRLVFRRINTFMRIAGLRRPPQCALLAQLGIAKLKTL